MNQLEPVQWDLQMKVQFANPNLFHPSYQLLLGVFGEPAPFLEGIWTFESLHPQVVCRELLSEPRFRRTLLPEVLDEHHRYEQPIHLGQSHQTLRSELLLNEHRPAWQ